jgi:hypothetical protein
LLTLLPELSPSTYRPHALHGADRAWPETNCFLDLWIELIHTLGLPPEPALASTVRQDWEGDQFGFSKIPPEDLEALYGLRVQELAIFEAVDAHVARQIARGRMCLVEVDPWFLPDTGQASYRREHGKTTIGINKLDLERRYLEYFHNAGYFAAEGDDVDGLFGLTLSDGCPYRPFVEFTALEPVRREETELRRIGRELLERDWSRRPAENPVRKFQAAVAEQAQALTGLGQQAFHDYAFHTARLLGANFELLGACLDWLSPAGDPRSLHCRTIAESTKAFPLHLARALARRRFEALAPALDQAAAAWDALFEAAPVRREAA